MVGQRVELLVDRLVVWTAAKMAVNSVDSMVANLVVMMVDL